MALSALVNWEIRTTGNDTNGGGFNASEAGAGTDYSQQSNAQVVYSDLVIPANNNLQLVSGASTFLPAYVGNLLHITSNAGGWITGWYEIVSVVGNTATLDRSPGAGGSLNGAGNLGGALATPGQCAGIMVAGNWAWIKRGTYTTATSTRNVSGGPAAIPFSSLSSDPTMLIGYDTSRVLLNTDIGPTIQPHAAFTGALHYCNSLTRHYNILVENPNGAGNTYAFQADNGSLIIERCSADNVLYGIYNSFGTCRVIDCCVSVCTSGYVLLGARVLNCLAISCGANTLATGGFNLGGAALLRNCIAFNSNGSGFYINNAFCELENCLGYGSHGANGSGFYQTAVAQQMYLNCLAVNNTQYGYYGSGTNYYTNRYLGFYFFGNGTDYDTGAIGGANSRSGTTILLADPISDPTHGDFSLNNVPNGGAICRAAG